MKVFKQIKSVINMVMKYSGILMALYAAVKTFNQKIDEYDPDTDTKIEPIQ